MGSRAGFGQPWWIGMEGQDATYSAGLGLNSPAATPTDIAFLQGVAGKTVKITRVTLSVGATASGQIQYDFVKRVGGTQTVADTPFLATTHSTKYDSTDPASAVITAAQSGIYTSNRTNGTLAGLYRSFSVTMLANAGVVFDVVFGANGCKCPTLIGATENFCINGASHTLLTTEKFGVAFEWIEF